MLRIYILKKIIARQSGENESHKLAESMALRHHLKQREKVYSTPAVAEATPLTSAPASFPSVPLPLNGLEFCNR